MLSGIPSASTPVAWPFASTPALAELLEALSQAASIGNGRFPPRNFRLERVLPFEQVAAHETERVEIRAPIEGPLAHRLLG